MTNSSAHRLQAQHIAMARKRQRRRAATETATNAQGHHHSAGEANHVRGNGVTVIQRHIATGDEGVLYTHKITERRGSIQKTTIQRIKQVFSRRPHDDTASVGSHRSASSFRYTPNGFRRSLTPMPATPLSPSPNSETLCGFRSLYNKHQKQYTISSKKKYRNNCMNWLDNHHMNFVEYFGRGIEVDNNVYRPSTLLFTYIEWTFTASFTSVFLTFLFIYSALCLIFGGFLLVAGNAEPNCIVTSGAPFGETPTKFSDAFALSWTTFTTVGYGMTYTSTASDFGDSDPHECSWVVFLCISEAFMGLLYAGMCAAILFGKVNRVQSHANIMFCNAVCLQYEEVEDDEFKEDLVDSERSRERAPRTPKLPMLPMRSQSHNDVAAAFLNANLRYTVPLPDLDKAAPDLDDEENQFNSIEAPQSSDENKFVDQFNGCPILKFQVVNSLCNREGGELVDCIMKVVGIKFKGPGDGSITHSQYVRVNLVDFEHPFLSRCWHGVHILDASSPLLTEKTRQRIRENNGSWPSHWFDPEIIRSKLEFHDLIVTVAGISNVSAVTVHAYKRYKIGDVLIGFNYAPITFRDIETGKLEVDLSMINDVREQSGIRGEDLSIRRSGSKEFGPGMLNRMSTIRIMKSKSGDGLGSIASTDGSRGRPRSGESSPASRDGLSPEKAIKATAVMSPLEVGEDVLNSPQDKPTLEQPVLMQEEIETGAKDVSENEAKED